ncbi:putative leader peptide [Catenulispora pinistramenti]
MSAYDTAQGAGCPRPRPTRSPVRLVLTARRHVDLARVCSAICPL